MIIIKINRNSKEKQIRSKPKKKENATTKVTKNIHAKKREKKTKSVVYATTSNINKKTKTNKKNIKKKKARPKWNRGMHKGRLN